MEAALINDYIFSELYVFIHLLGIIGHLLYARPYLKYYTVGYKTAMVLNLLDYWLVGKTVNK